MREFVVLEGPREVTCSICYSKISRGELRLTANLGSGYFFLIIIILAVLLEFIKTLLRN